MHAQVGLKPGLEKSHLLFAEQPRCDIAHVRFLKLVIPATILVDSDIFECGDHRWNVKAHSNESVNQLLVVSVIPSRNVSAA